MKKYILVAVILFVACNTKDKNIYLIKGMVDATYSEDSVYLLNEQDDLVAKAPVIDGKFEIAGGTAEPFVGMLAPNNGMGTRLIVENGAEYEAKMTETRAIVTGGGELHRLVGYYDNSDDFFNAVSNYERVTEEIFSQPGKTEDNLTPKEVTRLAEVQNAVLGAEDNAMFKVVDDNNAPPLARVFAIARSQNWDVLTMEKRMELLNCLNQELGGNNSYINRLLKSYKDEVAAENAKKEAKEVLAEGMNLLDFGVKDSIGNSVRFSNVVSKNKYTILEFWASWCKPCRNEIPNLKKNYEKYKEKGLEVFAVSLDEKINAWHKAMNEVNTPWLNYHDPAHFNGDAASYYAVDAIPASFLFRQDGKLVVVDTDALRGPRLEETLSKFLK